MIPGGAGRDIESETQLQITWFPPDRRNGIVRTGTERQIRAYHNAQKDWNPVIERRTVTVSAWEMVTLEDLDSNMLETDEADG